jgi:hypothetical protein
MHIDPPNTVVEPNLTHETIHPIKEAYEERIDSNELKTQDGAEQA